MLLSPNVQLLPSPSRSQNVDPTRPSSVLCSASIHSYVLPDLRREREEKEVGSDGGEARSSLSFLPLLVLPAVAHSSASLLRSSPSSLRRFFHTPSVLGSLPSTSSTSGGASSTILPSSSSPTASSTPPPSSLNPEHISSTGPSSWTRPLVFASLVVLVGAAGQTLFSLDPVSIRPSFLAPCPLHLSSPEIALLTSYRSPLVYRLMQTSLRSPWFPSQLNLQSFLRTKPRLPSFLP